MEDQKNMFKRTITALLAMLMIISCLPIVSLASGHYVKGSVTSMNPNNPSTVELKKDGNTVYSATIPASEGKGEVTQDFEINGVTKDTYDLIVSKEGHLSATVKNVVVNGSLTLSENAINLIAGDIDNDGFIDATDVSLFVSDLGKDASQAAYATTDISGDGYRDGIDVSILAFNLLKPAPEQDYVEVEPDEDEDEVKYKSRVFLDCDQKYGSFGTGFSFVTSDSAPQGTGYYSATDASCPVIMARHSDPIDISEYKEGGFFTFKLYVDDVTNLKNGVGIDLWQSASAVSTWSNIPADSLKNGWNDVTVYVADMTKDIADFASIRTLRVFAYSKSGNITIGIDDINLYAPETDKEETMLRTLEFCDCDAKYASYGDGFSFVASNDAPQGTGYYSATGDNCPVILAKPSSPVDISDCSVDGYFTFKFYVDDVTNLKSGVGVDLWQSGKAVCAWNAIPADSLVNGWNDVTLYISDMKKDEADYSAIGSFRIFAYAKSGNLTIGLDDIKVTAPYDPNANKFALTFDPGEGTGIAFESDKVEKKYTVKLPECTFTKNGYTFIGWKNDSFIYAPGYSYTVTDNETLTAQWVADDGSQGSQYILLESFDNKSNGTWWGTSAVSSSTSSPVEGSAYLSANDTANESVICGVFASPLDLTEYEQDGVLKISIYVEDASKVSTVQFEIANADASNKALNTVSWTTSNIQNGWNTYNFKLANTSLGNIDLANVKYTRVVLFTSGGAGNWGMDGLYVAHAGKDYALEYAMEKALSDYIVYGGSENANAAIANTMKKAEAGEDITIVAFGTSTLGGAGASNGNGWIHHATRWFEEKFPNATFTLVNSGIGSSESVLGSARFQKECLDHNPDIIFFEMGNNDNGLPHGEEAYEGILTQLVQSGTPVFALNSRRRDGSASTAAMRDPLNELYDIPTLDFNAYSDMFLSVNPPEGFSGDEMWSADAVHPSNRGHQLMAELAIDYLEGIYADYKAGTLTPAARSTELPTAKTANKYVDSILYQNYTESTEQYSYTLNGFTDDFNAVNSNFHTDMDGWQADSVGDKITFKTTAGYFAMFFTTSNRGGIVKISVDGVQVATKDTYSANPGWPHSYNFTYHVDDGLEHTVELEVIESTNGSYIGLTAVTLANFAD